MRSILTLKSSATRILGTLGLAIVLLSATSSSALADNSRVALIIGGGLISNTDTTDFNKNGAYLGMVDEATKAYVVYKRLGYDVHSIFGPDNLKDEDLKSLKKSLGEDLQSLSRVSITKTIRQMSKWIIKTRPPNLKFVIQIADHGQEAKKGETSHGIALGGVPERWFSLDHLKPLRAAIEVVGGRMLIFDSSCFSGASLSLADDSTCVISTAGMGQEEYVSNPGSASFFEAYFFSDLSAQAPIETQFLDARQVNQQGLAGDMDVNKPEISTSTNMLLRPIEDKYISSLLHITFGGTPYLHGRIRSEVVNPEVLNLWISKIKSPEIRQGMANYIHNLDQYWSLTDRATLKDLRQFYSLVYRSIYENKQNGAIWPPYCSATPETFEEIEVDCKAAAAQSYIARFKIPYEKYLKQYQIYEQTLSTYENLAHEDISIYDKTYRELRAQHPDHGACSRLYL